jgi:hypothetical protein
MIFAASCGGSGGAVSPIPAGTYILTSVACETGTLTQDGRDYNQELATNYTVVALAVRDGSATMGYSAISGPDANNVCALATEGPLTHDGATVTFAYEARTWAASGTGLDGAGGCPAAVQAASATYEFSVDSSGNLITIATDEDDPIYMASLCTTGRVSRTFEKQATAANK